MGLKDCKECKNQVAEHAVICVHCGIALPGIGEKKKPGSVPSGVLITFAFVALISVIYLLRIPID